MRRVKFVASIALLVASGCGEPARGSIRVTADPNPVPLTKFSLPHCYLQYGATLLVTARETGGARGTVTRAAVEVHDTSSGALLAPMTEVDSVHLPVAVQGHGALQMQFVWSFQKEELFCAATHPEPGPLAFLVTVGFVDDNGNGSEGTLTVPEALPRFAAP